MKPEQSDWLAIVREKVETLRYGVVQIVIHDSRVTLIERIAEEVENSDRDPRPASNF